MPKKTRRYTLRLEKLAQQCAEEKAVKKGMSMNQYIETLILEDCKK